MLYIGCSNSVSNNEISNCDALWRNQCEDTKSKLNGKIDIKDYNEIIKSLDSLKDDQYNSIITELLNKKKYLIFIEIMIIKSLTYTRINLIRLEMIMS